MAPFSRDIDNFWYKLSRIVLTEPSPDMYVRRLRWSKEILNDLHNAGLDISNITDKQLLKLCNSILINELNGLEYLSLFFTEVCSILKINLDTFPTLHEHHESFFNSSKSRIERLKKEVDKCILVCANCHIEIHEELKNK